MFPSVLEIAAANIARLTPNAPPGLWIPVVIYGAVAVASVGILVATRQMSGSWIAAAAAAIGFVATSAFAEAAGPLLIALMLAGMVLQPRRPLPGWLFFAWFVSVLFVRNSSLLFGWCLAGCGLHYVSTSVQSKRWPRVAGISIVAVLLLILITAPLPAAGRSEPPAEKPMGHDRATLTSMRALLSNIPTGSDLVRDDVLTNILVRAGERDFHRARVYIDSIENAPEAVRPELKMGRRVFALPHAQRALAMRGFKIVDSLHVADRGLAEVISGGDCVTASQQWQTTISLTGQTHLAFVADRDSRTGPVVIYLAGAEAIHIDATNWPARTLRGFSPRTFDLSNDRERADFERQRTEDGGPWTVDLSGQRSITRVALWRMPDSALAMPIGLSAAASYAAVKLAPEADRPVSVCPAFPVTVSAIR